MPVIIHIDMNCFFVQCHRHKNPDLINKPIAVQQHDDIICVSYEARDKISKHDKPNEALQKYPELTLVHVEKFENTTKVTYRMYREQSSLIMNEIQTFVSRHNAKATIEKSSIDEVYIDVTDWASEYSNGTNPCTTYNANGSVLMSPSDSKLETNLLSGCEIANLIRQHLLTTVNYSTSAGISYNKMLAKLGSQMKSPNAQTVISESDVPSVMSKTRITKLPRFGIHVKDGEKLLQPYTDKLKYVRSS